MWRGVYALVVTGVIWSFALGAVAQSTNTETIPRQMLVECRDEHTALFAVVDQINELGYATTPLRESYQSEKQSYEQCHHRYFTEFQQLLDEGNTLISRIDYLGALALFQQARDMVETDQYDLDATIGALHVAQGRLHYQRGEYDQAREFADQSDDYPLVAQQEFRRLYLLALISLAEIDYEQAEQYAQEANGYATDPDQLDEIETLMRYVADREQGLTRDPLSYRQFWLQEMGVDQARSQFSFPHQVVVAVIDNGIDLDHPDLADRLWVNTDEIPDNGRDDDGNGYIDDYHGYNFLSRSAEMEPDGGHGTQVAGIIGAAANNRIDIAGIMPEVVLMPLIVCEETCLPNSQLGEAIRYAVDQGASVINMSLVSKNGNYNNALDEAIRYAAEHNVSVVVAAGNGIRQDDQEPTPVDTTLKKISPVCNDAGDPSWIIGVGALTRDGREAPRANYGECIDIHAYGEEVITTTFLGDDTEENLVAITDGTSFSAPIIAGIVGLGHAARDDLTPRQVYEALRASREGLLPQADRFLAYFDLLKDDEQLQVRVDQVVIAIRAWLLGENIVSRQRAVRQLRQSMPLIKSQLEERGDEEKLRLWLLLDRALQQQVYPLFD